MSNNRIFASGIRQDQGRSANLTGAMLKRSPIFTHVPPQKQQILSPFANYNCRSTDSLYTAESQTSLNDQKVNAEWITKIVREQLMKWQSEDSSKKQIGTIQAQLNDIKERIAQYEKSYDKRLQDIKISSKEDLKVQSQRLGQQIQNDISSRLRTFFQKANIEMKKDILTSAQQQFLTLSYGDDLQNRLQIFNERIEALNDLIASKNNLSSAQIHQKVNSMVMNEQYEPRLSKIEKQFQLYKKGMQENVNKNKMLQQRLNDIEQRKISQCLVTLQDRYKLIEAENSKSANKINKLQEQQDISFQDLNKIRSRVQEQERQREQIKIQLHQLQKITKNQLLRNHEVKTYLTESNSFQTSIIVNNSSISTNELNKNSSNNENSELSQLKKIETVKSNEYKEQKQISSTYQVDSDGFLMDGDNRYLLTESGQMIRLDASQIKSLLQSNLVQIIDS